MASVEQEIPAELQPAVDAALAWINRERGTRFRVTGLVDADRARGAPEGEPVELGLVLCEGDLCLREQVRVEHGDRGLRVSAVDAGPASIPADLDPPVGVRRDWLGRQLEEHAFVLLLFYRGLW